MDDPSRLFAFDLAKELGRVDVDGMLSEITVSQLYEWMQYARRKPFGEERADLRAGIIAATMANMWRSKGSRQYKPADFMPQFRQGAAKRQTPQQMKQILNTYAIAHDAYVKRKAKRA